MSIVNTVKVRFGGGFHNSADKIINIKINQIGEGFLSEYQRKSLDRHFCGIPNCLCGGLYRADFEILNDEYKAVSSPCEHSIFLIKK